MSKHTLFLGLVLLASGIYAQVIPSSRTVDWTHAGHEGIIPDSATFIDVGSFGAIGDGVTDNHQYIANAINSLNGNRGIIYFPSGNYLVALTLYLPDSVILRGASSDSTHLIFNFSGTSGNCIQVSGSTGFSFTDVTSGFQKGSNFITVSDTTGFSNGGFAEIREDNGYWDTHPVFWADYSVGQVVHIQTISGDTLFFSQPLRISFDSSLHVQVRKFVPAREAGIECMNISRSDSVSSGLCIGIYFDHAYNCWVRGVESSRSVGSHLEADASSHLEITGNYFHHSFAYDGVSTHGYGITLFNHTGDCKIEDNIMRHLRHSFSLQCGANGNVIAYNYSSDPNRSEFPSNFGADISLHGHYPFANLFEGNIVQNILVDSTWGPSGPFNTFFRNRAELYGIMMSGGMRTSDSMNFAGNEITGTGPFQGNYILAGADHFEYGNNVLGVIAPAGTTTLNDTSYFVVSNQGSWYQAASFPTVGEPVLFGSGSIPAKDRFLSGGGFTVCSGRQIQTNVIEGNKIDFELFPNPVTSELSIRASVFSGQGMLLEIFSFEGGKIFEKNFKKYSLHDIATINVSFLSRGIYILKISDDEKNIRIKKLVKG
ncbi:MAG: glycosyl hydrolase family 28-related protein [Bacteroidetes bacterium]|nr:glycosyl hydrolase family 28-related protein [Bacteroidota bacterium]